MRFLFLLFILNLFTFNIWAQDSSYYWISFKYKGNNAYSLSDPIAYLSPKAIERRTLYNIAFDSLDLPVNPDYINTIQSMGALVVKRSKWLNGIVITNVSPSILTAIYNLPYVQSGMRISPRLAGRDHGKSGFRKEDLELNLSHAPLDYGLAYNQIQLIKGDCLHELGYRGEGMTIALLDGGFYNVDVMDAFDSLFTHKQIKGVFDFVDMDTIVYDYASAHGTYVLSCMAAYIPGVMIGTAPKADYYLLRTENTSSEYIIEEYNWALGAEYADSVGADIINSSLGYTTFDDTSHNHTYADMNGNTAPSTRAADIAASRGILVVNSAGNSGNNSWYYIGAPADGDSVLTVGAIDSLGMMASFSSYGPTYDGDVKPNACAKGKNVIVAYTGGGVTYSNGTSFASPILCGVAACLWQSARSKNNIEILHAIEKSAHTYSTPTTHGGYGIPDFCQAYYKFQNVIDASIWQNLTEPIVFPNPFTTDIIILYEATYDSEGGYALFDAKGKYLAEKKLKFHKDYIYQIPIETLNDKADGVYFIHFDVGDKKYILKTIKGK